MKNLTVKDLVKGDTYRAKFQGQAGFLYFWDAQDTWAFEPYGQTPPIHVTPSDIIMMSKIEKA